MTISVLIVGLGKIGMGYDLNLEHSEHIYSHARSFSVHEKFQLVAAVELDLFKRKVFTANYSCPAYINLAAALEHHQPDLIIIATQTQDHLESIENVLKYSNPKIILCEKPLSYDLDDARKIIQICAVHDVKLFVNYMRRSDPGVIEIKRRLENNKIIPPYKGVVWYSKGFMHNGSHFFNLMEFWFGQMNSFNVLNYGRKWDGNDPEPDVQVTFEKANILFLAAWEESFSHYTVELLSPSGRLRYEQGGELIQWQPLQNDSCFDGYTSLAIDSEIIVSGMKCYQLNVAEQLSREYEENDSNLCAGSLALITLENIHKIIEK